MNESRFVIDTQGRVFLEHFERSEIEPGDALQKAFTTNVVTTARNFMELPGHGPIHVVHQQSDSTLHISVPLETINFRTTFKAIKEDDGYKDQFYPTFAHKDSGEPILEMEWNRADAMLKQDATMRIRFHLLIRPSSNGDQWLCHDHYLYAFDGRGVAWRLPLGNLYETCQVCMGQYNSTSPTVLEAVQKAIHQFRTAPWNSDLFYQGDTIWKFIRFKSVDNKFHTQPILAPWTTLCTKVSTALLKFCQV